MTAGRAFAAETNGYKSDPGPLAVGTVRYEWKRPNAPRRNTVKSYYPKTGTTLR